MFVSPSKWVLGVRRQTSMLPLPRGTWTQRPIGVHHIFNDIEHVTVHTDQIGGVCVSVLVASIKSTTQERSLIVVVGMSTAESAREAPREFASTIAQGQDKLCDSPLVFQEDTREVVKAFSVLSWEKVHLPECGTSHVQPHLSWSSCFIVLVRLTRPVVTCQHNDKVSANEV